MTKPQNAYEHWMYGDERDSLPEKPAPTYRVLVGNMGWVTDPTTDHEQAMEEYNDYVEISKTQTQHRGYQEQVSLWSSDEYDPLEIYDPPEVEEREYDHEEEE